jgi:hypothetical protein
VLVRLGGIVLGLGCFFFACRAIKCPACHVRWVWDAMRRHSVNRWLSALVESRVCPACGYPDGARQAHAA